MNSPGSITRWLSHFSSEDPRLREVAAERIWNYYAARMRLARELGVMGLDPEGRWIDDQVPGVDDDLPPGADDPSREELPLPPAIPINWVEFAEFQQPPPIGGSVHPAGYTAPLRPSEMRRLPPTADEMDTNGYNSQSNGCPPEPTSARKSDIEYSIP